MQALFENKPVENPVEIEESSKTRKKHKKSTKWKHRKNTRTTKKIHAIRFYQNPKHHYRQPTLKARPLPNFQTIPNLWAHLWAHIMGSAFCWTSWHGLRVLSKTSQNNFARLETYKQLFHWSWFGVFGLNRIGNLILKVTRHIFLNAIGNQKECNSVKVAQTVVQVAACHYPAHFITSAP